MSDAATAQATLEEWTRRGQLTSAILSDDGTILTLQDASIRADTTMTVTHEETKCSYTIASIFLHLLDPFQSPASYLAKCSQYQAKEPVKPLDKAVVLAAFFGFVTGVPNDADKAVDSSPPSPLPSPPLFANPSDASNDDSASDSWWCDSSDDLSVVNAGPNKRKRLQENKTPSKKKSKMEKLKEKETTKPARYGCPCCGALLYWNWKSCKGHIMKCCGKLVKPKGAMNRIRKLCELGHRRCIVPDTSSSSKRSIEEVAAALGPVTIKKSKPTYFCPGCGSIQGKWKKCRKHIESCCSNELFMKQSELQKRCLLRNESSNLSDTMTATEIAYAVPSARITRSQNRAAAETVCAAPTARITRSQSRAAEASSVSARYATPDDFDSSDEAGRSSDKSVAARETSQRPGVSNLPAWMAQNETQEPESTGPHDPYSLPSQGRRSATEVDAGQRRWRGDPRGRIARGLPETQDVAPLASRMDDYPARSHPSREPYQETMAPERSYDTPRETSQRQGISNLPAWITENQRRDTRRECREREVTENQRRDTRQEGSEREVSFPGLPPCWKAFLDEASNRVYFYNCHTRESSWELPAARSPGKKIY